MNSWGAGAIRRGMTAAICGMVLTGAGAIAMAQVFRERADVPTLGLRVPMFAGARRETLEMPQVRSRRDGADVYEFRALWYRSQWSGEWSAGGVARLRLGWPTWMPPAELMDRMIDGANYNEIRAAGAAPKDMNELAGWLGAFVEGTATPAGPISRPFLQVTDALRFDLDLEGANGVAYAFRFRANTFGVPPGRWHVVVVAGGQSSGGPSKHRGAEGVVVPHGQQLRDRDIDETHLEEVSRRRTGGAGILPRQLGDHGSAHRADRSGQRRPHVRRKQGVSRLRRSGVRAFRWHVDAREAGIADSADGSSRRAPTAAVAGRGAVSRGVASVFLLCLSEGTYAGVV